MEANLKLAHCRMKIAGLAPPFVQRFYREIIGQEIIDGGL
jgi:hypothetical protein